MPKDLATKLMEDYENGSLSRREVVQRLLGLGAAMGAASAACAADQPAKSPSTFEAKGLDHIALNVTDVARSREFYQKHLGLEVLRDGGQQRCFMGPPGGEFILALFQSDEPGMNHYCYGVTVYTAEDAEHKLKEQGLEPRREDERVYFPDPDGITVQLARWSHR